MKKLLLLFLLLPLFTFSQLDCDNYTAVGISYVLPKGFAVEGSYFTGRFNAGIGIGYTLASHSSESNMDKNSEIQNNNLDIFAYAGYKLVQVDYVVSAFINAGYTMGNVNGLQPFVSTKILFPAGNKAFSVEPFYIVNRCFSARASLYLRL